MERAAHNDRSLQRFTLDGSIQLECRLAELCEEISGATLSLVPRQKLQALVLGGGYGRGHGGVLKTPAGDALYNDLEFYVFLKGNALLNQSCYRQRFEALGELLSPKAGLHVEFKIDSLDKLRRRPVSIFSYDLVTGHRTVYGSSEVFAGCEHHRDSARIEPAEATRLLLNRCSGLLLVKELLLLNDITDEQCDFIGRNLAKAQLALGDALLAADANHLVSAIQRVSHHVAPELSGSADNAHAVGMTLASVDGSTGRSGVRPVLAFHSTQPLSTNRYLGAGRRHSFVRLLEARLRQET